CEGGGYDFGGVTLTESGIYVDTLASAGGCDSIVTLELTVQGYLDSTITVAICEGGGYDFGGVTLTESGIYVDTLASAGGCDSIVTLELAVLESINVMIEAVICQGDNYIFGGEIYGESGEYTDTLFAANGCDSIVVLQLTVLETVTDTVWAEICQGQFYDFGGWQLDEAGIYSDTLTSQGGCDSIIHLVLDIVPAAQDSLEIAICQGEQYVLNGVPYTQPGIYTDTISTMNGCDSIITLLLSVNEVTIDTMLASICAGDTLMYNGMAYTESGAYTDTTQTANGCDSIMVILLEVFDPWTIEILGDTIFCEGDSVLLSASLSGLTYLWSNGQTTQEIHVTENGTYYLTATDENGCTAEAHVNMHMADPPVAFAGDDVTIDCAIREVAIGPVDPITDSIFWSGPAIDFGNQHDQNPVVDEPGWYVLTVINAYGCMDQDSMLVSQMNNYPQADAGPPQILNCLIDSVLLQGSSNGSNLMYAWTGPGIHQANAFVAHPLVGMPGVYILTVTDTLLGCTSTPDTVVVEEDRIAPEAFIASSGVISCYQDTILLDASGSTQGPNIVLTWTGLGGQYLGNGLSLTTHVPGTYILQVVNEGNGCMTSDTIEVLDIRYYPDLEILPPPLLTCRDTQVVLTGQVDDPSRVYWHSWTGPVAGILEGAESASPLVGKPGTYHWVVTDSLSGCMREDSVVVIADVELPFVVLPDSGSMGCHDPVYNIIPIQVSTGPDIVYAWTTTNGQFKDNVDRRVVMVETPGTYHLTVTNEDNGCMAVDSSVVIGPQPIQGELFVVPSCHNEQSGLIEITNITGGEGPYLVSLNGEPFSPFRIFNGLSPDTFHVVIRDTKMCEWDTIVIIESLPPIYVDLGTDVWIKLGDTAQLNAETNIPDGAIEEIDWIPADDLSCTDCLDPLAYPTESTEIRIILTDTNHCIVSDVIQIYVDSEGKVYIPNAFSPNNDGTNDRFVIYGDEGVRRIIELRIYDRWGNFVFHGYDFPPNDPYYGWDGKFRGKPMDPAVLVYWTTVEMINGQKVILKGEVQIVDK
ncbi:MAG: gliding motility-associated C-terminal domain-containing protein, partial [Saprospiraceae bacterium]|nr:gliding motility-associated C-terminal domain-containing protein [Saprospiraceae bacterium]